jgi:RHS repeat-associated protein
MIGETHQINRYSGYRHLQVSLCQADIPRATMIITSAAFSNDADYTRVKGVLGGVSMIYIAGIYEWQAGAATKYYDGGAMRRSSYTSGNGIFYILKDQLGSTSVVVSQSGSMQATNYYYPYGGNRGGSAFSELTTKRFTGQYHEVSLSGSEGLSYYGARWYDAQLGRFASPDSLVPRPDDPQSFNRFAYARGNPINRADPNGHGDCPVLSSPFCQPGWYGLQRNPYKITFAGNAWTQQRAWLILIAAEKVDIKLRKYGKFDKNEGAAWAAVHGSVTVKATGRRETYTNSQGNEVEYGAQTTGAHGITFHDYTTGVIPNGKYRQKDEDFVFNTIHEFGHLFAANTGTSNSDFALADIRNAKGDKLDGGAGFIGGDDFPYRQHPGARGGEEFADMYLNWVLGTFAQDKAGAGQARQTWMDNNATNWVTLAVASNK